MGQAKLFKRLRKEAEYKWIGIEMRKYLPTDAGHLLKNCSRVLYRQFKKEVRNGLRN